VLLQPLLLLSLFQTTARWSSQVSTAAAEMQRGWRLLRAIAKLRSRACAVLTAMLALCVHCAPLDSPLLSSPPAAPAVSLTPTSEQQCLIDYFMQQQLYRSVQRVDTHE